MRPLLVAVVSAMLLATTPSPRAQSESLKPELPWVQFHGSDFTRPADSGVDPQIDLDTGQTIQGYSRLWRGIVELPDFRLTDVHREVARDIIA